MDVIKGIWDWLSGKKTVIGSIFIWIATIAIPFIVAQGYDPAWLVKLQEILAWIGGILVPVGVGHKVAKAGK